VLGRCFLDVVTVVPAESIDTVVNLMMRRDINRIPGVLEGKLWGSWPVKELSEPWQN